MSDRRGGTDRPDRTGSRLRARLAEILGRGRWKGERGSVLVVTSFALVGMMGMVALAVDLGMLHSARSEAQRAADAGAMAGAARYASTHGEASAAEEEAIRFAEKHTIRGHPVDISSGDVDVLAGQGKVRVRVAQEVGLFFGKVLGFEKVLVEADAAAEARPAGAASCPLPIAVVDRWDDQDDDGKYDAGEPYIRCPDSGCTSYEDPEDRGLLLEVKSDPDDETGGGGGKGNGNDDGSTSVVKTCEAVDSPSWHCWFRTSEPNQGGGGGSNTLDDMVDGCTDPPENVALGQTIWAASGTGNKQSVVKHIKKYIDQNDPDAYWDADGGEDGHGCVKKPHLTECLEGTPRLRLVPLIDPSSVSGGGSGTQATTSHLAMVFLEKVASGPDEPHGGGPSGQWNVYVRFAGGAGARPGGEFAGSLAKAIQLVE